MGHKETDALPMPVFEKGKRLPQRTMPVNHDVKFWMRIGLSLVPATTLNLVFSVFALHHRCLSSGLECKYCKTGSIYIYPEVTLLRKKRCGIDYGFTSCYNNHFVLVFSRKKNNFRQFQFQFQFCPIIN